MKTTFVLIIFLVIVCLSMGLVFPSFAGTWRDDFEDRNTREWEIFNHDRQVEKWWINKGEAVGEIFERGFISLWLTGELNWRFYSVSCRAMLEVDRNDPPSIGLTLHDRSGTNSRYEFYIDFNGGVAVILKILGGEPEIVRKGFAAKKGVWYNLTATVFKDGTLEFKIDDFLFRTTFPTNPLNSGKTGFVIGDARARFDDVEITGDNIPNGGPFDVEPQAKLATTWAKLKIK